MSISKAVCGIYEELYYIESYVHFLEVLLMNYAVSFCLVKMLYICYVMSLKGTDMDHISSTLLSKIRNCDF